MRLFQRAAAIALWTASAAAFSNTDFNNQTIDSLSSELHGLSKRSLAGNITLRILPIGASIVWGYGSTDGNGFRYPLRNALVYGGNPVNMIGSVETGTMLDNNCECYGSNTIDQMSAHADYSIPFQPNLVVMHMGSNDMSTALDYTQAHVRYGNLVDKLFAQIPNVTIIASTMLPLQARQDMANYFNAHLPDVIQTRQAAGKKIALADMSSSFFSYADQVDGQHPNDFGYKKMAAVFYQTILEVADLGWLTPPADTGISDVVVAGGTVCDKDINGSIGPYQIQYQLGWPDGDYVHNSADGGVYYELDNPSADGIHWADIDGDGIDDYVYVSLNLGQGLGVSLSLGGGVFGKYLRAPSFAANCERAHVQFADINGDGRSDVCCVDNNGDFQCWLNWASGGDTRLPNWESTGYLMQDSGFTGAQVRLADIDGDGKSDYVGIDADTGLIWGWRNLGPGYIPPTRWLPFGGVASGLPTGLSLSGWRFADLNGDHKDDLLHVDDHGRVTTWINQRGLSAGSLTPNWISFGTHGGDEAKPINITFGKFWGTGRADYSVNYFIDASGGTTIAMARMIQNLDSGSTSVRGDGTRYCDMTGDGKDDTIWISIMGEINVYGNVHVFGETPPLISYGAVLNVGRTRREIVLADFDGDKKCDVLLVDKLTGATTMFRNDFANGTFAFTNIGVVTGSATCATQYGFEFHDNGVRWHDIDGDGRADFLCFKKDGVIYGYLNKGVGNMINQGMIKHAEGRERQNLRMGDVNGDGRADLIWVDQVSSAAQVWYNEGPSGDAPGDEAAGTSAFRWRYAGAIAYGSDGRGSCIEFANINGIGRADYILVYPVTNRAFSMFNVCPGGLEPVAPDLPDPPPITYPIGSPLSGCTSGSNTCCTGGTGQGNYAELCSFTCTYGLCPPPCTCTSNGPGNNPPPTNQASGFAIDGLDPATFDLLCEFACSRGLCPEVSCVESLELNTPSDLPLISPGDLDPLNPTDFDDYVEGDSFWYDFPDNNQFSLNLFLIGGPATNWTNTDCGPETGPGDYGETLGCEAMSVAYLFYGLALNEAEEQDPDIITRDVAPRGLHYERHQKWAPKGNITTRHKLLAHAPLNTWVMVGNGTYNGIPHEMHFINHEDFSGYRVVQNQTLDTLGTLDARSIYGHKYFAGTEARYYMDNRYSDLDLHDPLGKLNNPSGGSEFIGESVEKASAESGRQEYCAQFMLGDDTSQPGVILWGSAALGVSASSLDSFLQKCNDDMLPISYTIYPRDPFDIADISALLASFPLANVVAHDSVSGWGMLYWTAELTLDQVATVRGQKQVSNVYRICQEGCPDPSDEALADRDIDALDYNITAAIQWKKRPVQRKKRQTGLIETQNFATTDLAFVSNTIAAGGGGTFVYDSSAGENILVYVVESRGFELTHPEFNEPNVYGQTISAKAGAIRLFGRPGFTPAVLLKSHGTAVLAQICGENLGVAKDIWPVLYNWEHANDKQWLLDALDNIYTDFLTTGLPSPDVARLSVLNLSFGIETTEVDWISKFSQILGKLVAIGVLPVASAGNDGVEPFKYPAILGNPTHPYYVPGLLVVGGVETDGTMSTKSNRASWLTLWAPMLALRPFFNPVTGLPDLDPKRGTSYACAKTSGLAAYFIAFSSLRATFTNVFAVSDYIRGKAFARGSSGLPAIYNGA